MNDKNLTGQPGCNHNQHQRQMQSVQIPTTDFDLRSTHWFQQFQVQAEKDEAKLALASIALDDVEKKMAESKQVIRTEEEKLCKFQQEVTTLHSKFVNAERDHRCNKDMVPYMNTYLYYLGKILSQKNGQKYTTNGQIQRIVKQTESAINITFNSLQACFGGLSRKTEAWYERQLSPDEILKEKLLFVLELPFITQQPPIPINPEVKQATEFLKRFLSDNQKQMTRILVHEGHDHAGKNLGIGFIVNPQRDSISSPEENYEPNFQPDNQPVKRICRRNKEWADDDDDDDDRPLVIKLEPN